jgi:DNA-binding FrmR family transcriptional regulator
MEKATQTQALKRLKIIKGHLEKVIEMVEKGNYCTDVLQQSSAVQSALKKVDELLLEGHLKTCLTSAIKSKGGTKEISEVMEAFKRR